MRILNMGLIVDATVGGAADGSAVPGRVRVIDDGHDQVHVHEHVNEHDHALTPDPYFL
ncbi:MAG: hypothetical protein ACR2L2_02125 [Acidobacteriota bacterium]